MPFTINENANLPLHKLIQDGTVGELKEFLEVNKKDINVAEPIHGLTPLHLAAMRKDMGLGFTAQLLKYGAEIGQDNYGYTPLHRAAAAGAHLIVKMLLDKIVKDNNAMRIINCTDELGNTALHLAANFGYLECVKMLIAHKINVDTQNEKQHTALYKAIFTGHIETAKILLENTKYVLNDASETVYLSYINPAQSSEEKEEIVYQLIKIFAERSKEKLIVYLAKYGLHKKLSAFIDDNSSKPEEMEGIIYAFLSAAQNGHFNCLKVILQKHQNGEKYINEVTIDVAMAMAVEAGQVDCVEFFLHHGVDLDFKNEDDQTFLESAKKLIPVNAVVVEMLEMASRDKALSAEKRHKRNYKVEAETAVGLKLFSENNDSKKHEEEKKKKSKNQFVEKQPEQSESVVKETDKIPEKIQLISPSVVMVSSDGSKFSDEKLSPNNGWDKVEEKTKKSGSKKSKPKTQKNNEKSKTPSAKINKENSHQQSAVTPENTSYTPAFFTSKSWDVPVATKEREDVWEELEMQQSLKTKKLNEDDFKVIEKKIYYSKLRNAIGDEITDGDNGLFREFLNEDKYMFMFVAGSCATKIALEEESISGDIDLVIFTTKPMELAAWYQAKCGPNAELRSDINATFITVEGVYQGKHVDISFVSYDPEKDDVKMCAWLNMQRRDYTSSLTLINVNDLSVWTTQIALDDAKLGRVRAVTDNPAKQFVETPVQVLRGFILWKKSYEKYKANHGEVQNDQYANIEPQTKMALHAKNNIFKADMQHHPRGIYLALMKLFIVLGVKEAIACLEDFNWLENLDLSTEQLKKIFPKAQKLINTASAHSVPVHAAVNNNNTDLLLSYVQSGFNLNTLDADGKSPLDCAITKENTEVICILLLTGGKTSKSINKQAQLVSTNDEKIALNQQQPSLKMG